MAYQIDMNIRYFSRSMDFTHDHDREVPLPRAPGPMKHSALLYRWLQI